MTLDHLTWFLVVTPPRPYPAEELNTGGLQVVCVSGQNCTRTSLGKPLWNLHWRRCSGFSTFRSGCVDRFSCFGVDTAQTTGG